MTRIFISSSRDDIHYRDALVRHLRAIQVAGLISIWHDGEILPGQDWKATIDAELHRAEIILLLVSASFLASDSCQALEFTPALRRWEENQVIIVPIIVRSCDWEVSSIGRFQGLPSNGQPVAAWPHPDDAWTDIAQRIRELATGPGASASLGRDDPFPPVAVLKSRDGAPVPPLIWQLRAICKRVLDRIANEFVLEPSPFLRSSPNFLTISQESLQRLWDWLSVPAQLGRAGR